MASERLRKDFYQKNFYPENKNDQNILARMSRSVNLHFRIKYGNKAEYLNFPNTIINKFEFYDVFDKGAYGYAEIVDGTGFFSTNILFKMSSRTSNTLKLQFNFSYGMNIDSSLPGKATLGPKLAFPEWKDATVKNPVEVDYDEMGRMNIKFNFVPSFSEAEASNKTSPSLNDLKVKKTISALRNYSFKKYIEKLFIIPYYNSEVLVKDSLKDSNSARKPNKIDDISTFAEKLDKYTSLYSKDSETGSSDNSILKISPNDKEIFVLNIKNESVQDNLNYARIKKEEANSSIPTREYYAGIDFRRNVISFSPDKSLTQLFNNLATGNLGDNISSNEGSLKYFDVENFLKDMEVKTKASSKNEKYNIFSTEYENREEKIKYERGISIGTFAIDDEAGKEKVEIFVKAINLKQALIAEIISKVWSPNNQDSSSEKTKDIYTEINPIAAGNTLDRGYLAQYYKNEYKSSFYNPDKKFDGENRLFPLLLQNNTISYTNDSKEMQNRINDRYKFVDLKTFLHIILDWPLELKGDESNIEKDGIKNLSVKSVLPANKIEEIKKRRGLAKKDFSETSLSDVNANCNLKSDLTTIDNKYSNNIYVSKFLSIKTDNIQLKYLKESFNKTDLTSRDYIFFNRAIQRSLAGSIESINPISKDNVFFFRGLSKQDEKDDPKKITSETYDIFLVESKKQERDETDNTTILGQALEAFKNNSVTEFLEDKSSEVELKDDLIQGEIKGFLIKCDININKSIWESFFSEARGVRDFRGVEEALERLKFLIRNRHNDLLMEFNEWLCLRRLFLLMGSWQLAALNGDILVPGSSQGNASLKEVSAKEILFYKKNNKTSDFPDLFLSDGKNDSQFFNRIKTIGDFINSNIFTSDVKDETELKGPPNNQVVIKKKFLQLSNNTSSSLRKLGITIDYEEKTESSKINFNSIKGNWEVGTIKTRNVYYRNYISGKNYDATTSFLSEEVARKEDFSTDTMKKKFGNMQQGETDFINEQLYKMIASLSYNYPFKVELVVPGDPFYVKSECDFFKEIVQLNVSELEKLTMNSMFNKGGNIFERNETAYRGFNYVLSKIFTGKYLVVGAKHNFERGSWTTTLKLLRNIEKKEIKDIKDLETKLQRVFPSRSRDGKNLLKNKSSEVDSFRRIITIYNIEDIINLNTPKNKNIVNNKIELIEKTPFRIKKDLIAGKTVGGESLPKSNTVTFIWDYDVIRVLQAMGLEIPLLKRGIIKISDRYNKIDLEDKIKNYYGLSLFLENIESLSSFYKDGTGDSSNNDNSKSELARLIESTKKGSLRRETPFTYMLKVLFSQRLRNKLEVKANSYSDENVKKIIIKDMIASIWDDNLPITKETYSNLASKNSSGIRSFIFKLGELSGEITNESFIQQTWENFIKHSFIENRLYKKEDILSDVREIEEGNFVKLEDILSAYNLQENNMQNVFFELGAEIPADDLKKFREVENGAYEERARKFFSILEKKFLGVSNRTGEPLFKIDLSVEKVKDKKNRKEENELYTHLFVSISLENSFYYDDKLYQLFLNNLISNYDSVGKIGM